MPYHSIFRPDLLRDRTILITGGGTGIGRVIAHELSALGAQVILAARRLEPLEKTAAEIAAAGGSAAVYTVNIRREEDVETLFQALAADDHRLDGLVNNAGGQFPSPAEAISQKGWHAVIETNLTGTFLMCRAAFNHGLSQTGGSIVNIVAEIWRGFPGMAHTGAARAGVVNLTRTLAVEWASYGIWVNAVAPGIIQGDGLTHYDPAFVEPFIAQARADVPLKRLGTESEVSAAVAFLFSPAAAYITGETIRVDGGGSLWRKTWEIEPHDHSQSFDGFDEP